MNIDNSGAYSKTKWGIIGLGKIAHKFAHDLKMVSDAELYAVASRNAEKADEFASKYDVELSYPSYAAMLDNPLVDAVYIATPHSFHKEHAMMCIEAGKAVLCEKPMAIHAQDVKIMIEFAKSRKVLLMEGLWTKFLPHFQKLKSVVQNGDIGRIQKIEADFGFKTDYDPDARLINTELGGGSLLDIGIYPVFLSLELLGLPERVEASATFFESGADSSCDMQFYYSEGAVAHLQCSLIDSTPIQATIYGKEGSIRIHPRFHEPTSFTIEKNGESKFVEFNTQPYGYHYEIEHFCQLLRKGYTQSPMMSFENSLNLIKTLDTIREKIGLVY